MSIKKVVTFNSFSFFIKGDYIFQSSNDEICFLPSKDNLKQNFNANPEESFKQI